MSQQAQGGAKRFIREVKFGLSVIGVLCVVFIVVAYKRFTHIDELPPAIINSSQNGAENGNGRQTGDAPARVLRSGQLDHSIESPSLPGFRPAEIRKPGGDQPETFLPPPQPHSFLPNTEFVEPQRMSPDPENGGAFDPGPSDFYPDERPDDGSPPGGEFRIDDSSEEPAAYVAPTAAYHHDIEASAPVQPPARRTIPVQRDDSFWLISERAYGTGAYFRALYEHNRERFPEPDRLPPGAEVDVPALSELRTRYPKLCPDFR